MIMGAQKLCKLLVGVRSSVGPPNFKARSYNGYYRGLSIRRWEFDSPTSRQVLYSRIIKWHNNRLITGLRKFDSCSGNQVLESIQQFKNFTVYEKKADSVVFWSEWNNGVLAGCNPVASRQVGSIPTHSTNF